MTDRCPSLEGLLHQAQLPPGHAGRAHLDHCPRCRSLVKSHAAFLAGSPAHADGEREARLASALEQEIGLAPTRQRPAHPVLRLLRSRATAPVLAMAAVLALAVGLQRLDRGPAEGPLGITRSAAPVTGLVLQAEWSAGGTLELSWQGAPTESRSFRVLLLGADLEQLASFAHGPGNGPGAVRGATVVESGAGSGPLAGGGPAERGCGGTL